MRGIVIAGTCAVLLTTGCDFPENNGKVNNPTVQTSPGNQRVIIEYHQSFYDTTAYGNFRAIIVVKDTVTGKEYLGVSGMGITEVGSHSSGKTQIEDEK